MKRFLPSLLLIALFACQEKVATVRIPQPATPEPTDPAIPKDYNVKGRVVDVNTGEGISGVVVSDGQMCVLSRTDGCFYFKSALTGVKFVWVSTPSGYQPPVVKGLPKFFKKLSDVTPSEGVYDMGQYELTPVENPDRFTLLVTADPQPRASGAASDKYAYHSLDLCEDLYLELRDVSSAITGRAVYGLCLGDIVHENMSLYGRYADGLAKLNYSTYNIIGNHDHNPNAKSDEEGSADFESWFGPANYSFNIGGIHFVVLDDIIMKLRASDNSLRDYDSGLTDAIMSWLRADLYYVPTTTTLMVAAHSPMFKVESGSERTNTSVNGPEYGELINDYAEVHAWGGHTHTSFNYVYPESHRHRRVQVHTVARSTGELWLNEYLASGTPRGFTIVEVDHGQVSWRFHPTGYQRPDWIGTTTGKTSKKPEYKWRDWDYDVSGHAVMKKGPVMFLDEDYQMHAYPRGAYGDGCVYVNVFLWDERWGTPVFIPEGGSPLTMEHVLTADRHDLATTEIQTHYKTYSPALASSSDYSGSSTGAITTLFRVAVPATPARGTVQVTDRFGNTYSSEVSW